MDANGGIKVGLGCSQSDGYAVALCDLTSVRSHEVESHNTLLPGNNGDYWGVQGITGMS